MPRRLTLGILLFALVSRLQHIRVLWVEEAYPTVAAINILAGKIPYRDFWFDKPPLFPYLYTLWLADPGLGLRFAGAAYIMLCAWLMARLAGTWVAGVLLAFFLIFDVPSATIVLGPDLLTIAPVLGALLLRQRPLAAGMILGLGFHCNVKAALFLVLIPSWYSAAGFLAVAAPVFVWPGYWEQVWQWGAIYARDTFLESPWREGLLKTAGWLGFHAALVIAAIRARWDRTLILWIAVAGLCVIAGLRFFPRYYFHLLPPLCLAAAQGLPRFGKWRWAVVAFLVIPAVRYGPSYRDVEHSRDLAMFRDARQAATIVRSIAATGDTTFTWGYRPEIDALTRLPAGTRFLESQPLTCVFADRHLKSAKPSGPLEDCARRRAELTQSRPTFVIDGIGRYNPELAIKNYPDLADWLAQYETVAIMNGTIIYRARKL